MKKTNIFYLLIVATIAFAGCAKDGETGPKGDNGSAGATGATGAAGSPGNANVEVKTFTVTVNGNINTGFAWTSGAYQHHDNNIPELTQAVVDSGAVMLYISSSSGWTALPWSQIISPNVIIRNYSFAYSLNHLWMAIAQSDGSGTWATTGSSFDYKLIIIPAAQRFANPHVNLNDYKEVEKTFNLLE